MYTDKQSLRAFAATAAQAMDRAAAAHGPLERIPPLVGEPGLLSRDGLARLLEARPHGSVTIEPLGSDPQAARWSGEVAYERVDLLDIELEGGRAVRVRNVDQIISGAAEVKGELAAGLARPLKANACDAWLLPAGALELVVPTETFVVVIDGERSGEPAPLQRGSIAFYPRETRVQLSGGERALVLACSFSLVSALDVALETIRRALAESSAWNRPVTERSPRQLLDELMREVSRPDFGATIDACSVAPGVALRLADRCSLIETDSGLRLVLAADYELEIDREDAATVRWMAGRPFGFTARELSGLLQGSEIEARRVMAAFADEGVLVAPAAAPPAGRRFAFEPRADDLWIATYPKSGTTWLQMIAQTLLHPKLSFEHIYEVCPYFEMEVKAHGSRRIDELPSPRIFKTHLLPSQLPEQARIVYATRDVLDVAVSLYHHRCEQDRYRGDFALHCDEFARGACPSGSWVEHVRAWWQLRDDPRVLFLGYEQLSRDFGGTVERICSFAGLPAARAREAELEKRCSFAAMKALERKFDHETGVYLINQRMKRHGFIRRGRSGEGRLHVPARDIERLRAQYRQQLGGSGLCPSLEEPPGERERG
jgi:hypothetical protein